MKPVTKFHYLLLFLVGFFTFVQGETLKEEVRKEIAFSPGGMLSLENTNGNIVVEGWDESRFSLIAEKKVRADNEQDARKAMEHLRVEIDETESEIRVKTKLPREGNGVLDWIFGDHVSSTVNYTVYVPRETSLDIISTNGRIDVSAVEGKIQLKSTNGEITAKDIGGEIRAHTTNGSIEIEMVSLDPGEEAEISTTNGEIKLYLPEDTGAHIRAKTTNGSIKTDFHIPVEGKYNSKRAEGDLKGGGAEIILRTVNGSISIRKL